MLNAKRNSRASFLVLFFICPSGLTNLHVLYILVWLLEQSQSDFFIHIFFFSSFARAQSFSIVVAVRGHSKSDRKKKKNRSGTLNIEYVHQRTISIVHVT